MKKTIATIMVLTLTMATALPAVALDYTVGGSAPPLFGKPTSVESVTVIGGGPTASDNIDRSKDRSATPPPFGMATPESATYGAYQASGASSAITQQGEHPYPESAVYYPADAVGILVPPQLREPQPPSSPTRFTPPYGLTYPDGSLGTLSIPRLGMSAKVYVDESLESLAKGIGHFGTTSCWEGNVGLASHNRGRADHFGQIHTLKIGDKITYGTRLGTRTYAVFFVGFIDETDFSRLGRTGDNIITLITCVRDVRNQRVCVQAGETT